MPPAESWDQTPDRLDVVCLGNALVDVLAHTTDEDLRSLALTKGSMALVDLATAAQIYGSMRNTIEVSGGSSANTAAGVAALGGSAGFIGKVAGDDLGRLFVHDISVLGVEFGGGPADGSSPAAGSSITAGASAGCSPGSATGS
jgi:sugar/nucleoside kinase (ribokinase family)